MKFSTNRIDIQQIVESYSSLEYGDDIIGIKYAYSIKVFQNGKVVETIFTNNFFDVDELIISLKEKYDIQIVNRYIKNID